MSSKNKFGFAPLETKSVTPRRDRSAGPMGVAVRETAENLHETTEAKVEQRRRNAEDAKAYRSAQSEGMVLVRLPVGNIATDDLPRDRLELGAVAASDEMEELKASIRERGQREPIEVFVDEAETFQLKKGWRRLTALTQLHSETGDDAFATVVARIEEAGQGSRIARYIDMVEENVVREDLTFAEMAQVAIAAAADDAVDDVDPAELVNRLYGALHKTKRSYIRAFVFLLAVLGDELKWPKAVSRNVGVDVARALKNTEQADALRQRLVACASADEQGAVLADFLEKSRREVPATPPAERRQKFEFFVGKTKVTARQGECRLVSTQDFATIPKERLEKAVRAFEDALFGPRIS